jgi:hypothetical protein
VWIEVLRRSGCRVLSASTGEDAVRTVLTPPEPIDVLIVDLLTLGHSAKDLACGMARRPFAPTVLAVGADASPAICGSLPADWVGLPSAVRVPQLLALVDAALPDTAGQRASDACAGGAT